jgi:hypothetical protein
MFDRCTTVISRAVLVATAACAFSSHAAVPLVAPAPATRAPEPAVTGTSFACESHDVPLADGTTVWQVEIDGETAPPIAVEEGWVPTGRSWSAE